RRLLDDDLLRAALGRRARRDALLRWSPHAQGNRYLEILETAPRRPRTVRAPGRRAPTPAWEWVAHDEPYAPHDLEPYDPAPVAPPAPSGIGGPPALADVVALRAQQARVLASRGVRSLLEDGLPVTARRAAARGRQVARWALDRARR
ncbi:MAG: hypothetical protein ACR2MO_09220, partial [Acidimicrobiales bacterium]